MFSNEQKYIPGFLSQEASNNDAWLLILMDKQLIMRKAVNQYYIPYKNEIENVGSIENALEYIGTYDGHNCYCTHVDQGFTLPENYEPVGIREITKKTADPGLFLLAGNAYHILHWRKMNRYCGCCGQKTVDKKDERAVVCPDCGNIIYPRISPATITAIFREDQILLAHNRNFGEGFYSLIAGFVEPGETLEMCVAREIREEVGLNVKNIKYFSSQPWPFPDSIMLAFTAEYDSGEITVDQCEIEDAAWFRADSLPGIPSIDSIAGKMIRWYQNQYKRGI